MKLLIVFMVSATFLMACQGNKAEKTSDVLSSTDTTHFTTIRWVDSVLNFGAIQKGEKIELQFSFVNTGAQPLYVSGVRAGCGCTVADYTKEAIPPGGKGTITAAFDSNKVNAGEVHKTVTVNTNTSPNRVHTLIFTGTVADSKSN